MNKPNYLHNIMNKYNMTYSELESITGVSKGELNKIANYTVYPKQDTMIAIYKGLSSHGLVNSITDVFQF